MKVMSVGWGIVHPSHFGHYQHMVSSSLSLFLINKEEDIVIHKNVIRIVILKKRAKININFGCVGELFLEDNIGVC